MPALTKLETTEPPPPPTKKKWKDLQLELKAKAPELRRKYVWLHKPTPFLILDAVPNPSVALKEMISLSDDMGQLVQSFIEMRLRRTHDRMKDAALQGNSPGLIHEKHEDSAYISRHNFTTDTAPPPTMPLLSAQPAPPSTTELHRIQRALWRLLVYSDFFHEPNPRCPISKREEGRSAFLGILTISELEEIECIYYHIREQTQLWADPASWCYSPELAERVLKAFGPNRNAFDYSTPLEERRSPEIKSHITYTIGFYRELMSFRTEKNARTNWPDTKEANLPNAGWNFLQGNSKALKVQSSNLRIKPVSCYLDWGYCIWDESRLKGWGLLSEENIERWAYA